MPCDHQKKHYLPIPHEPKDKAPKIITTESGLAAPQKAEPIRYRCQCGAIVAPKPDAEIKTHNHGLNSDGTFATEVETAEVEPPSPIMDEIPMLREGSPDAIMGIPYRIVEWRPRDGSPSKYLVKVSLPPQVQGPRLYALDVDSADDAFAQAPDLIMLIAGKLGEAARKSQLSLSAAEKQMAQGLAPAGQRNRYGQQRKVLS